MSRGFDVSFSDDGRVEDSVGKEANSEEKNARVVGSVTVLVMADMIQIEGRRKIEGADPAERFLPWVWNEESMSR